MLSNILKKTFTKDIEDYCNANSFSLEDGIEYLVSLLSESDKSVLSEMPPIYQAHFAWCKLNSIESTYARFKRKFYYKCKNFTQSNSRFAILIGPRKIGKTYCLRQLSHYDNAVYVNFKSIKTTDELEAIINDLRNSDDCVYC